MSLLDGGSCLGVGGILYNYWRRVISKRELLAFIWAPGLRSIWGSVALRCYDPALFDTPLLTNVGPSYHLVLKEYIRVYIYIYVYRHYWGSCFLGEGITCFYALCSCLPLERRCWVSVFGKASFENMSH